MRTDLLETIVRYKVSDSALVFRIITVSKTVQLSFVEDTGLQKSNICLDMIIVVAEDLVHVFFS